MSKAKKPDPGNRLPLGEFSGSSELQGISAVIKVNITGVRYDANEPGARDAMKRIIGPAIVQTATVCAQTLSALLACLTKDDTEGAEAVRRGYAEALAALSVAAVDAITTVAKRGSLASKVIVPSEMPKPPLKIVRP